MDEFEYKTLIQQKKMALDELRQYHKDLRRYECENNITPKGIEIRKRTYHLIRLILKIDHLLSMRTVKVIGDRRTDTEKSKIYTCTHIGRYDIESAIEAIGEAAWFIMGDPGETYQNFDGLLLRGYGVSWFEMDDPYDAHTVNVRQKNILLAGGNELSFPEAAWHLDPIYPVGELHPGAVRRAIHTDSVIIPVGIEQYRGRFFKNYYVNIGEVMDIKGAQLSDAVDISRKLREDMAGLKYEIWENYGKCKRSSLNPDWQAAYEEFIDSIMCDTENGYTIEEIEKTKYKDESVVKPIEADEVFACLNRVNLNSENAFLARDILAYNTSQVLKKSM